MFFEGNLGLNSSLLFLTNGDALISAHFPACKFFTPASRWSSRPLHLKAWVGYEPMSLHNWRCFGTGHHNANVTCLDKWGLPQRLSWERIHLWCRRQGSGFDPWRRVYQPIPVFLPGKSPGQRSLVVFLDTQNAQR